ncbi:hypothetical protein HNR10_000748 [Nocardiopsis aegyptia]|uniref:Uncharacterized protein n=1 Tax=Nocardiopsis aegyptia TaxID=220378 RepID=A0A7Z0J8L9_9ACTN|nr:hypothetical protein [Nocardiopsis aegyptia]
MACPCATVHDVIASLDPALTALANQGSKYYRQVFDA